MTQPVFETTATALREKSKLQRHDMRELAQIVPLAVIVLIGVLFYVLGGKTRGETAAEPVAPAYVPAESQGRAS